MKTKTKEKNATQAIVRPPHRNELGGLQTKKDRDQEGESLYQQDLDEKTARPQKRKKGSYA